MTESPHFTVSENVLLFLDRIDLQPVPEGFSENPYFMLNAYGKWSETTKSNYINEITGYVVTSKQIKKALD